MSSRGWREVGPVREGGVMIETDQRQRVREREVRRHSAADVGDWGKGPQAKGVRRPLKPGKERKQIPSAPQRLPHRLGHLTSRTRR